MAYGHPDARLVVAPLAGLVALTLVGAPFTMNDWGEQATLSVEKIDQSQVRNATPVLHADDLSAGGRAAVERAIESPDGYDTVYGREDWPADFTYSDNIAPGRGICAVVNEGDTYRLTTDAAGGFPFVYWLRELPFVVYGLSLAALAVGTYRDTRPPYLRRRRARLAGRAGAAKPHRITATGCS
ncbi:hypothetical protein MBEHAL_0560 [Halarchaeum acidiphilum MH1-52-1]|uniref:DUF7979 domain-containing protein n=1 Tax=Halarchaeum acidiphilum MH1-52-1 TaxID=1261545 RepID=U2YS36_9EURY|nr:hypothetical protein [Halarchaeum acidiphilum]GAD51800.1 hypothetical protein MBEHAL_0560 [Halarchaeum acidiphilum MH1-52-1]